MVPLNSQIKQQRSQETRQEVEQLLDSVKKCLLVRPTGFGKTYLTVDLAKNYDKVYYFYPQECLLADIRDKYPSIITMESNGQWESINYMTLVSMSKDSRLQDVFYLSELFQNTQKILFILDEAHMAGAEQTSKVIYSLLKRFPNAYWLGATATPDRMDDFDISKEFFDGFQTSPYTFVDAFNDGIYSKLHYITSYYAIDSANSTLSKSIEAMVFTEKELADKITRNLNRKKIECSHLFNMPDIFKKHLDSNADYQKYICFFSNTQGLKETYQNVINSFQHVYPNHTIEHTILINKSKYKKNINVVQNMSYKKNTIHLIFCIDMLNMGYHIDDLDGIIMLRRTLSDTIYKQQLGRCLSISSTKQPYVFDLVENCELAERYNTIFDDNQNTNSNNKNTILGCGKELLYMHDETKDIRKLNRIVNIIHKSSMDISIIADAYLNKFAPINWVLKQLRTKDIKVFKDILDLCDECLRPEDEKLLCESDN